MKKLFLSLSLSVFTLTCPWNNYAVDNGTSPLPIPPTKDIIELDNSLKSEENETTLACTCQPEPARHCNIPQALVEGITIGAGTGTLYALIDTFVSKQLQSTTKSFTYGLTIPLASIILEPIARFYFVYNRTPEHCSYDHIATLMGSAWIASWMSYVAAITKSARNYNL